MQPGRPSLTAQRVAMRRAAHQILDQPRVLEDPVALKIIGPDNASAIRANPAAYNNGFSGYMRAFLVARSRIAEDALAEAVARGVAQYVILGAGLDTFAYRNPFPARALRVFEVDYPATQAWKLEQLRHAEISIPETLTYVPVDFESQALTDRLRQAGFRTDTPTFFSWLGVTMYLDRETVMSTLRWIASTPKGGGIVFDYAVAAASLNFLQRLVYAFIARRVAAVGEPWRTRFDPRTLVRELREMDFAQVDDISAREVNQRYFANRTDGLKVGGLASMISARV
jgi:methyltransferase (TIGR00027 family)